MTWIVITIKPNQSYRAEKNLIQQKINCFFPRIEEIQKGKRIIRDIFKGYAFVNLDTWGQLVSISATRGVSNILKFDSRIPSLPDYVIHEIKKNLDFLKNEIENRDIKIGDCVIISSDILKGKEAVVLEKLRKQGSKIILLQLLDNSFTVWIDEKDVSANSS